MKDKVEDVIEYVKKQLRGMGVDISDINFIYVERCVSNAKMEDGEVHFCAKSLRYEPRDQVGMCWHEVYHVHNDEPWSKVQHDLEESIVLSPPADMAEYLRGYIKWDTGGADISDFFNNQMYNAELTVGSLRDPVYYQNEINAYEAEILAVPDVSKMYEGERLFLLWRFKELLKLANKYY